MKSIKKIAGDILIYFYYLQRKNGTPIVDILRFSNKFHGPIVIEGNNQFNEGILRISEESHVDAFNAINYLHEKELIECKISSDTGGDNYIMLRVSALGVDVIEGIERGERERNEFNFTFNIKLADTINVDSLIKNELDNLFKASLI
jgi:hypothetical protein